MEAEIREQGSVLAREANNYYETADNAFAGFKPDMVVLAARGSSDHAALYARYLIEIHLEIPVSLAAPSVLTRYGRHVRYRNALGIGISQSGAAPDVAEVIAMIDGEGHRTYGITNTAGSRLTHAAKASVVLNVGVEQSVAATKTYTSSLLALYQLVRALGANLPDPLALLPDQSWIDLTHDAAANAVETVLKSRPVFTLARGFAFSTANETALKLMECALVPAKAYSTSDFEHGPKALAGPHSAAVVYGENVDSIAAQGCKIVAAPEPPSRIPEELLPIWQIVYGQWLALHCARASGLNPDKPQFIHKITETI